jgi:pimeloyl-ACP methyl ester carboxylesterase
MRGETTDGFLAMAAEAVAGRVPHGTLETIPDAGHLAPMERPEAVAAAVLRAVDSG